MKYPKEYLDEIKLKLKVSQVVGKYVKLKKLRHLLLMMKKVFITVLAQQSMEIFLTF